MKAMAAIFDKFHVKQATLHIFCFILCFNVFLGDSSVVGASPSSFGQVVASGPPVASATPAISLFQVSVIYVLLLSVSFVCLFNIKFIGFPVTTLV